MKVVHLSHADSGGGAALAALRLHRGLRQAGVESSMLVGRKSGDDPWVQRAVSPRRAEWLRRLDGLPRRFFRSRRGGLVSPAWVGSDAWKSVNRAEPALAHLHWICEGFLSVAALRRIRAPLVWSLHDMWALGGAEHYLGGCTRFVQGYRAENRPADESGLDLNRWVWERKRRAWRAVPRLTVFAVSEWLADRARRSVLFRDRRVEVLHNGVDPEIFAPRERGEARRELGLEAGPDTPLVLFGAIDADRDTRKGYDLLQDALTHLHARIPEAELVVFGNRAEPAAEATPGPFRIHRLGPVHDARRLATLYAACDVMVVPSREEAFGQTAIEAMACGTPVAAFAVGGLVESVQSGATGHLAPAFDTGALAAGIGSILERRRQPEGRAMSAAARERVLRHFTLALQASRCRRLYERTLEEAA